MKVIPNASQDRIEGWKDGMLRIRLRAVPEKGKANEALVSFLAVALNLSKASIRIISGHAARIKRVSVEGLTEAQIHDKLNSMVSTKNVKDNSET